MAIFHMNISVISRGKGRSAVGASAYRAGEKIENEYDGLIHDYTNKKGIEYTEVILPENAPEKFKDRKILWNEVEKIEKSSKAQLSREVEVALPKEFSLEENINLLKDYVQENFVKLGMCADIAIHDKKDGNPHAHIMLTMRLIKENGEWGGKSKKEYTLDKDGKKIYDKKKKTYKCKTIKATNWDEKETLGKWRENWAIKVNERLLANNIQEKISHLSLEEQGIERIPQIHVGSIAAAISKKCIVSKRVEINRDIIEQNKLIEEIESEVQKYKLQIMDTYSQSLLNDLEGTSDRVKQILLVVLIIEKFYEINPEYKHYKIYEKRRDSSDDIFTFSIPKESIYDRNFNDIYEETLSYLANKLGIKETAIESKLGGGIGLGKHEIQRFILYYIYEKDVRPYEKVEVLKYSCNLKEYLQKKAPVKNKKDVDLSAINNKLKDFIPEE